MQQGARLSREDGAAIRILSDQHLQSGLFPYQGHMRAVEGDGMEWGEAGQRDGSGLAGGNRAAKLRHQPAAKLRGEFRMGWNNDRDGVAGASSVT